MDGLSSYVMYGRFRRPSIDDYRQLSRNRMQIDVKFDATEPVIYETGPISVTLPRQTGVVPTPPYFNGQSIKGFPTGAVAPTTIATGVGAEAPPRYVVTFLCDATNPVLWINQGTLSTSLVQIMGMGNGAGSPSGDYTCTSATALRFRSATQQIEDDSNPPIPTDKSRFAAVGTSWFELFERADFLWTCTTFVSGIVKIDYQRAHWLVV
jgi:hypothetical protein